MASCPPASQLHFVLPNHPNLVTQNRGLVPLPEAEESAESLPVWAIINGVLGAQRVWSVQNLLEVIELLLLHSDSATVLGERLGRKRIDKTPRASEVDLSFLRQYLYQVLTDQERAELLSVDLPWLAKHCLRLPQYFPDGLLPCQTTGEPSSLALDRSHVGCLLGHMFFCTTRTPPWSNFWGHMGVWHGHNWIEHPPRFSVNVYFRSLFAHVRTLRTEAPTLGPVLYERRCINDSSPLISIAAWAACDAPLLPLRTASEVPICDVDMDFANKDVTFGTGSTQEERLLGMSPELLLLALFAPTLADKDALVITGAQIAGECTLQYRELVWAGHYVNNHRDWRKRLVCCVDALEIDAMTERWSVEELRPQSMLRELSKLYAAWQTCKGASIGTGHWGCGTFGGHKQTKALIQVMVASRVGAHLVWTSVEDFATGTASPFTVSLARLVSALHSKGVTVGVLFTALLSLGDKVPHCVVAESPDVWALLAAKLNIEFCEKTAT